MNIPVQSPQFAPENDHSLEICPGASLCFVILALKNERLHVLCEASAEVPECHTLPRSGIYTHDGVLQSAEKYLNNLCQEDHVYHEQLQTFGGGVVPLTITYYALTAQCESLVESNNHCFYWCDLESPLNFWAEQAKLIEFALRNLRIRASIDPVIFHLLPKKFTLLQLQRAYEAVLGVVIGKSNFRRKIAKMEFLRPCQEWQQGVAHRAARLYEVDWQYQSVLAADDFDIHATDINL